MLKHHGQSCHGSTMASMPIRCHSMGFPNRELTEWIAGSGPAMTEWLE
nr:hypothetical protein [uncultured Roseibium sp.]